MYFSLVFRTPVDSYVGCVGFFNILRKQKFSIVLVVLFFTFKQ
jgi:hypothetical protein